MRKIITLAAFVFFVALFVATAVMPAKSSTYSKLRDRELIYNNVFCKTEGDINIATALKAIGEHEKYAEWTTPGKNMLSGCHDKGITGQLKTVKPMRLISLYGAFIEGDTWFEMWYVVNDKQEYGYTYLTGKTYSS